MVNLYDEALLAKLNKWTEKTELHIYSPEQTRRMIEVIADNTNDKPVKLPIVCLRRKGGYTILNTNKKPLTYDGFPVQGNDEKAIVLNAIPISIQYQLDIYTRYLKEADAYCRDFIFNIINHPNVPIVIPYNDVNFIHNSTIRVSADVEDNSDIPERLVVGQFSRMSLSIDIDDAYLWDTKVRKNIEMDIDSIINVSPNPIPSPDSDDETPEWVDNYLKSLGGLNVVVHDTGTQFVVEPILDK